MTKQIFLTSILGIIARLELQQRHFLLRKEKRMKIFTLILVIFFAFLFASCDNPVDSNFMYNWEGHGSEFNEAYRDSILFISTRAIGTQYVPALHYIYKDGSGIHAMSNIGNTYAAAWSPRKWKILFEMGDNINDQGLFIVNYDGSEIKRLTSKEEYVFMPASWSPDGQLIAYLVIDTLNLTGTIKIMKPDGSSQSTITSSDYNSRLSWFPDSKRIVYDRQESVVYSINVDGSNQTQIFSFPNGCYAPVCSPDGNFISFSGAVYDSTTFPHYHWKIFSYNIGTGKFKQLTYGTTFETHSSWSPDSKQIVFDSKEFSESPPHIYIMNSDGTNIKSITDTDGYDYNPSWYNN